MVTPIGDCYRFAIRFAREFSGAVVHGMVTDKWNGDTYPHAWVEHNERVWDWQTQHTQPDGIPMDVFVDNFQPSAMTRYTPEQAGGKMCRSGHYGPWD